MNRGRRRVLYSLGVLICASLCALVSSTVTNVKAEDNFNYASISNEKKTLGFGSILKQAISSPMDEREINYLDSLANYKLQYSESFNKNNVHSARLDGDLYVFAEDSSYVDEAGRTHTWKPVAVVANENRYNIIDFGEKHFVKIPDSAKNINKINIEYKTSISLPSSLINPNINLAYTDAISLNDQYDQYLVDLASYNNMPSSLEEYNERQKAYEEYVEAYHAYLSKYENYQIYLEKYEQYLENEAKYQQYLLDKEAYDQAMIRYRENQDEWVYYNENHERNLKEYNEFGRKYDESRYQINAMNIANTVDTQVKNSIKDYVLGTTVTEVLSKKDELSVLGVSMLVIDEADVATKYLRTVLREYFALKTDEERYAYYYTNYKYIVSNTLQLTRALANLVKCEPVMNVCREKGKEKQFKMLVAALVYFSNAIYDKTVYNYEAWDSIRQIGDMSKPGAAILDENYLVLGNTYKQVLQGYNFIDTNQVATPSTGIWPTQQVILIPEPEHMSMPIAPEVVKKEVAPEVVEEPIAPTPVIAPTPYNPDATEPILPLALQVETNMKLVEAYREGKIVQHSKLSSDVQIQLNGSIEVSVAEVEQKLAIFVDYQNNPLDYVLFNLGEEVNYTKEIPTRPGDAIHAKYLFDYWSLTIDGSEIDLKNLTESTIIYPVFAGGETLHYLITWNINGEIFTTDVLAGKIPVCPVSNPSKPETDNKYYVFNGFTPAIVPALENATYTALFIEKNIFDIKYVIDGNIIINKEKEGFIANAPSVYSAPDGTYYEISSWDKIPSVITEPTTYTATSFKKYYTITWKYGDVVEKQLFLENTPVVYSENFPVQRQEDGFYVFTWSEHDEFAHGNAVITGSYVRHSYPVIVLTIDQYELVLTGQYIDGEEIIKPTIYYGETCYYEITGWEDGGSGNYIADFIKHEYFDSNVAVHLQNNGYYVNASKNTDNSLDLALFLSIIGENNLPAVPLTVHFKNGDIKFSSTQVQYLALRQIKDISLSVTSFGNNAFVVRLNLLDSLGNPVAVPDLTPDVIIKESFDSIHSYLYLDGQQVNASFDQNGLSARLRPNTDYNVIPTYNVELISGANVSAQVSQKSGNVGDKIHLSYEIKNGYKLQEIKITSKTGKQVNLDENNDFIIPASDVVIQIVVVRETYTLELYIDDELFATYSCRYGDVITLPTYVKKVGTEEYEYVFAGWGIYSESIEIKSNTKLYAQFNKIAIEKPSEKKASNLLNTANIVMVSVIGAGLVAGIVIILVKIRKPRIKKQK